MLQQSMSSRGRRALAGVATLVVCGLAAPLGAQADGPGSVRHGWSASVTRTSRARPAAGPATPTTARSTTTRSAPTAYFDNASNTAEVDQPLPPLQVRRGAHRWRRSTAMNLACSGAKTATFTTATATGSRASTSTTTARARRARRGAAEVRRDAQREDGRRLDRRQQLQLRSVVQTASRTSCTRRRGGRTTATTTRR